MIGRFFRSDLFSILINIMGLITIASVAFVSFRLVEDRLGMHDDRQASVPPPVVLSKEQKINAGAVLSAARERGASKRELEDAFTAAWAESMFYNLANDGAGQHGKLAPEQDPVELRNSMRNPYSNGLPSEHGFGHGGDHGSIGIFQQQYPWWGSVGELMNPKIATFKFLDKYREVNAASMPYGKGIQAVQHSVEGDGSNYAKARPQALYVLKLTQQAHR